MESLRNSWFLEMQSNTPNWAMHRKLRNKQGLPAMAEESEEEEEEEGKQRSAWCIYSIYQNALEFPKYYHHYPSVYCLLRKWSVSIKYRVFT